MSSKRLKVALVAAALVLGTLAVLAALRAGPSGAQQGSMLNCPQAGKWAIAVWDGDSGATAADALATCGAGAVAAAYSLDAQTQVWSRWFADKPEVSNLAPLNDMQGLLALGGAAAAAGGAPLAAAQAANQMQNCPTAGKWAMAVWDGSSGATAADALATCGAGAVAAAYSLDAQTQVWSRWFADKPEVSNLAPLDDKQGVLALGAGGEAPPPPAGPEAELAAALYAATDTDAAAVPMLQVYDYLGAGLYTVDGQAIQAGAETGPDDFRLYDFESGILLQAYIERQRFPVDRLATFLGQAGLVNPETGQPFTASEWLAVLAEAVSRGRADDSAFTVRLIDALGLVRSTPLDLTAPGLDPATTYLDAVQVFLILYDVLGGAAEAGAAGADSATGLDTIAVADNVKRVGQILLIVLGGPPGWLGAIAIEAIHDFLLSTGFKVTVEPSSAETHYFPCEGSQEVTLKAKVVYDQGKYNEAIRNANLYGFDYLPVPGEQDDMRIFWTAADKLVPKSGSWKGTADTTVTQLTDKNGEAGITFVPKTERRPGEGRDDECTKGQGVFEARLLFRSINSSLLFPLDWIGVGAETNYAMGRLFVNCHRNWTVEIEGSGELSGPVFGGFRIFSTSIPLEKADGGLEGTGTANWEWHGRAGSGDDFCDLVSYPPDTELHVQATDRGETLTFNVSHEEQGTWVEYCCHEDGCEYVPFGGSSATTLLVSQCSVPAEDGASVSCPWPEVVEGVTASFTLKLKEE